MQPQNRPDSSDFHKFISGNEDFGSYGIPAAAMQSMYSSSEWNVEGSVSGSEGGEGEGEGGILMKDDDVVVMDDNTAEARALTASNNHKEAEKRRRQRINSHLDSLRTLLPCNSRTDKATLLAKVVQRLKDLKQQSSDIMQLESFPSESDDIFVVSSSNDDLSDDPSLLIKASFCCEDRSDLIPDLVQTLKSLRLSPLRAEMVTFGGRIRYVLIVSGDKHRSDEVVVFLREALRSLVQRSGSDSRFKRQRKSHF